MKQFLLNPDGCLPPGVDEAALIADEVRLVLPMQRPIPAPGYSVQETEPVLGEDGKWRQAWAEVPDLAPLVPPVPRAVSLRQAREILIEHQLLDAVEAAIASIADPTERRKAANYWEYSQEVERGHPMVADMAAALGLNELQIDEMFRAAAAL